MLLGTKGLGRKSLELELLGLGHELLLTAVYGVLNRDPHPTLPRGAISWIPTAAAITAALSFSNPVVACTPTPASA